MGTPDTFDKIRFTIIVTGDMNYFSHCIIELIEVMKIKGFDPNDAYLRPSPVAPAVGVPALAALLVERFLYNIAVRAAS